MTWVGYHLVLWSLLYAERTSGVIEIVVMEIQRKSTGVALKALKPHSLILWISIKYEKVAANIAVILLAYIETCWCLSYQHSY